MNVLQRGVRSVLRKPIKSIILLFIVIVMSGLFLGAMASRSASIYTQDATRQAIGATFRIEGNEENRRKRLDQAMDVLGDREGSYGGVTHKWFIFSERNADLKVRTAGTGKYWYLYRWIYCTGFKNTRCGGSYNERNGSDGYWDDIRYFDYCSISSRNHDNEEKAEADIK